MTELGEPYGVCECGEPLAVVHVVACVPVVAHVGPGAAVHRDWVACANAARVRRRRLALLALTVIALFVAVACAGCTATARRIGGSAALGAVAYLESQPGEARLDQIGDRIGEAAGRGAARGARAEASSVPWWQWAVLGLLVTAPVAGIWIATRALGRLFTRELRSARGLTQKS
mgnify:FL=1